MIQLTGRNTKMTLSCCNTDEVIRYQPLSISPSVSVLPASLLLQLSGVSTSRPTQDNQNDSDLVILYTKHYKQLYYSVQSEQIVRVVDATSEIAMATFHENKHLIFVSPKGFVFHARPTRHSHQQLASLGLQRPLTLSASLSKRVIAVVGMNGALVAMHVNETGEFQVYHSLLCLGRAGANDESMGVTSESLCGMYVKVEPVDEDGLLINDQLRITYNKDSHELNINHEDVKQEEGNTGLSKKLVAYSEILNRQARHFRKLAKNG